MLRAPDGNLKAQHLHEARNQKTNREQGGWTATEGQGDHMNELNKEYDELTARMRIGTFIELMLISGTLAAIAGVGILAYRLFKGAL